MTPIKNALGRAWSAVCLYLTLTNAYLSDAAVRAIRAVSPAIRRLIRSGYAGFLLAFLLAALLGAVRFAWVATGEYLSELRDIFKTPRQYRESDWE